MKKLYIILLVLLTLPTLAQKKTKASTKPTIAHADSLFVGGKYNEAITTYTAALKDPAIAAKDARSWYRLGASYFNINDYAKALAPFEKAWTLNHKQPGARLALTRTYSLLNNMDKGIAMLDSTVTYGAPNVTFFDSDPTLDNLRKDPRFKAIRDRAFDLAYPCGKLAETKQFDFWVGEWDVYPTANPTFKTGYSKVTKESKGCVVLENWLALAGPHEGMSINYYDALDKQWKQKWAGSAQDVQDFDGGQYIDKAMRFKYIGKNPDGTTFTGRLTFSDLPDGKVRQHFERTDDAGKTWQTLTDLTYVRKSDGANP